MNSCDRDARDARLLKNVHDAIQAFFEAKFADAYQGISDEPSLLRAGVYLLPNHQAYNRAAYAIDACNDQCLDIAHRVRGSTARQLNKFAPVHRLPQDVVIEVLRLVNYTDRVHASQAFSRWREIALGAPSLWNVITIAHEGLGRVRRLHELAERTRDAPLHLTVLRCRFTTVQRIVATYAERLATFDCGDILSSSANQDPRQQQAPPDAEQLIFPRCKLLSDLRISGGGRTLRFDNELLPKLKSLSLRDVDNMEEIIDNVWTPTSVALALPRPDGPFGSIDRKARLKLSTLHSMIKRCHGLWDLQLSGLCDGNTIFDTLPDSMRLSPPLMTLFLGTDGLSNTLRLLDCLPARQVVVQNEARRKLFPTPPRGAHPLAAMFRDLQEPVTVTITPTCSGTAGRSRRFLDLAIPQHDAGVVLTASDHRGLRREIRSVVNLRETLEDSGLLEKAEHLVCTVNIWFDRLARDSKPDPIFFPQLSHLRLNSDVDFPVDTALGTQLPDCPMLRSLVLYDQRTPQRILRAAEVDDILASIAGTESKFEGVEFVGTLLASASGGASFKRASRVEFKTIPGAIE